MVTSSAKLDEPGLKSPKKLADTRSLDSRLESGLGIASSIINYEKIQSRVFPKREGHFQRISPLVMLLLLNCILLAAVGYLLTQVQLQNYMWTQILDGSLRFSTTVGTRNRSSPYFENKLIRDTPLTRLVHQRRYWRMEGMDFGLNREKIVYWIFLAYIFTILGLLLLHIILCCFLEKVRSSFTPITLAYGFIGSSTFFMFMWILYSSFVHQISSYLQNARHPPNITDNKTQSYFVNLTMTCAFSFIVKNPYTKYIHPARSDGKFLIEGNSYSKLELIELGLCPRQNYKLIVLILLFFATVISWYISSYSESCEIRIQGPPVYIEKFKIRTVRGLRSAHLRRLGLSRSQNSLASSKYSQFSHVCPSGERDLGVWEDAYNILDGGGDHIDTDEPVKISSSTSVRLYKPHGSEELAKFSQMKK